MLVGPFAASGSSYVRTLLKVWCAAKKKSLRGRRMPRQGGCKSSVRLKLYEANYLARAAPRMVVILERCIRVTHFEELPAITTHAERATDHCAAGRVNSTWWRLAKGVHLVRGLLLEISSTFSVEIKCSVHFSQIHSAVTAVSSQVESV
jgi:hypothetical protein